MRVRRVCARLPDGRDRFPQGSVLVQSCSRGVRTSITRNEACKSTPRRTPAGIVNRTSEACRARTGRVQSAAQKQVLEHQADVRRSELDLVMNSCLHSRRILR
jgi:hypothetical protein